MSVSEPRLIFTTVPKCVVRQCLWERPCSWRDTEWVIVVKIFFGPYVERQESGRREGKTCKKWPWQNRTRSPALWPQLQWYKPYLVSDLGTLWGIVFDGTLPALCTNIRRLVHHNISANDSLLASHLIEDLTMSHQFSMRLCEDVLTSLSVLAETNGTHIQFFDRLICCRPSPVPKWMSLF